MMKWAVTIFIATIVLTWLQPLLRRLGLGRLPGDLTFKLRGRDVYLPFTTTLLLSGLLGLFGYLV